MWLIELLREGNRAEEHVNRFEPNGRYGSVRAEDIAIIDFRRSGVRKRKDGLSYVIFTDDAFNTTELVTRAGNVVKINLSG